MRRCGAGVRCGRCCVCAEVVVCCCVVRVVCGVCAWLGRPGSGWAGVWHVVGCVVLCGRRWSAVVGGLRGVGYGGLLAGRLVLCVGVLVRRRRRAVRGGNVGVVRGVGVVGVSSWYVGMTLRAVASFDSPVVVVVPVYVFLLRFVCHRTELCF